MTLAEEKEQEQEQRHEKGTNQEQQSQPNQQRNTVLKPFRADGKTRWDYPISVSEYHAMIDRAEETLRKLGYITTTTKRAFLMQVSGRGNRTVF
jgi:hypothetical protein